MNPSLSSSIGPNHTNEFLQGVFEEYNSINDMKNHLIQLYGLSDSIIGILNHEILLLENNNPSDFLLSELYSLRENMFSSIGCIGRIRQLIMIKEHSSYDVNRQYSQMPQMVLNQQPNEINYKRPRELDYERPREREREYKRPRESDHPQREREKCESSITKRITFILTAEKNNLVTFGNKDAHYIYLRDDSLLYDKFKNMVYDIKKSGFEYIGSTKFYDKKLNIKYYINVIRIKEEDLENVYGYNYSLKDINSINHHRLLRMARKKIKF